MSTPRSTFGTCAHVITTTELFQKNLSIEVLCGEAALLMAFDTHELRDRKFLLVRWTLPVFILG